MSSRPLVFILMVCLTWVSGCDDAASPSPTALTLNLYAASEASDPYAGVAYMVVRAEGPGIVDDQLYAITEYTPGGSLTLDGIPWSQGNSPRQIVVEGWSATADGNLGAVLSRGRSVKIMVLEQDAPQVVNVLMASVNSFLPLTSSVDKSAQTLVKGRVGHCATLNAFGDVVVTGGASISAAEPLWWQIEGLDSFNTTVEVIDQSTSMASATENEPVFGRSWHTATALDTGQIILAGGYGSSSSASTVGVLDRAEVVHPGTWAVDVLDYTLGVGRAGHSATLVDPDTFTILFVGGDADGGATYELWSPLTGSQGVQPLPDQTSRRFHGSAKFDVPGADQSFVLISGGESSTGTLDTNLIYSISSQEMIPLGGQLLGKGPRTHLTATYVPGQDLVYMVGGFETLDRSVASAAIDVFDIAAESFLSVDQTSMLYLETARGGHSAALLDGNAIIFVGGMNGAQEALSSVEFVFQYYDEVTDPVTGATETQLFISVAGSCTGTNCPYVPFMDAPRLGPRAVTLDSGMALVVGGAYEDEALGSYGLPRELLLYNPPAL